MTSLAVAVADTSDQRWVRWLAKGVVSDARLRLRARAVVAIAGAAAIVALFWTALLG